MRMLAIIAIIVMGATYSDPGAQGSVPVVHDARQAARPGVAHSAMILDTAPPRQ